MANKASKFSKDKNKNPLITLLAGAASGAAVCIAMFTLLLFVSTAFAMKSSDPSSLYTVLGIGASIISAFVGGIAAAKLSKDAEIISSLICGAVLALAAFLLGAFIFEGSDSTFSSFVFILFPIICLIGGFVGKPKISKKKKFSSR